MDKPKDYDLDACSACGISIKVYRQAVNYQMLFGKAGQHFCVSCFFLTIQYGFVKKPESYHEQRQYEPEYENA